MVKCPRPVRMFYYHEGSPLDNTLLTQYANPYVKHIYVCERRMDISTSSCCITVNNLYKMAVLLQRKNALYRIDTLWNNNKPLICADFVHICSGKMPQQSRKQILGHILM